jgi:hypothetical protein
VAITDEVRQSLVIFLDLSTEVAKGLLDAEVEKVESIQFLNWSHTINDELLRASFKEAYTTLQDQVTAGAQGAMGMYGMGAYGAAGMSPYGGGYGDPYGGGYGGTYYGGDEASYSDTDDPEKIAKAKEAAEKRQQEAMKQMEEMMENQRKLKERQEKLGRWTPYYNTNQIPQDYYAEYREQSAAEGQQEFFLRYSMKTDFRTDRENLAKALHNLEFGSKLAFLSQLSLAPDANNPTKIDTIAHLEFNFMNDSGLGMSQEGTPPAEGDSVPGEAPVQSSQAPPPGTLPEQG